MDASLSVCCPQPNAFIDGDCLSLKPCDLPVQVPIYFYDSVYKSTLVNAWLIEVLPVTKLQVQVVMGVPQYLKFKMTPKTDSQVR